MNEAIIEYGIDIGNDVRANTVASSEVIDAMYPSNHEEHEPVYVGDRFVDANGTAITPFNSRLEFSDTQDGRRAITGNTVVRLCPNGDCAVACAIGGLGLSTGEMARRNCARANTTKAFEAADVVPEGRFVLLPTSDESYVVGNDSLQAEMNGGALTHYRLKKANSVVFTESWLRARGLSEFATSMQGADGSDGIATFEDEGENVFIAFASLRGNMGDRGPEKQILRQGLEAYFDARGYDEATRQAKLADMQIAVSLGASASLSNFAHQIKVPRDDAENEREQAEAAAIRARYPELIAQAGGNITTAIVLESQYPGALGRGSIFPELEAKLGIRVTPITPDGCPGDGQTCHVDYRAETSYALVEQLRQIGVPKANISYDDSHALDPGEGTNNAASNRAEQNNGVVVAKTNRTLNAIKVELVDRTHKESTTAAAMGSVVLAETIVV